MNSRAAMTAHPHFHEPFQRWPILLGLLAVLALGNSRADEWFLKVDGVPGALPEGPQAGWTPVRSLAAFLNPSVNFTNAAAGSPAFSCTVRKAIDRMSPALIERCAGGESLRRVTLAYVLAEPRATQYRITLDTAFVAAVGHGGSRIPPGTGEEEAVTFRFDKVELACFDLDSRGGTTGGLTGVFDQTTGQGLLKSRPPLRIIITPQPDRPGVSATWPAESGHRYQILACESIGAPWRALLEVTASEDGPTTQFVPLDTPALLLRVAEVD